MYDTAHKCGKTNGTKGRNWTRKRHNGSMAIDAEKANLTRLEENAHIEHWTICRQQKSCWNTGRNLNPWSKPRWTRNRWTSKNEYLHARWTVFESGESEAKWLKTELNVVKS